MNCDDGINLETDGASAIPFADMLSRIHLRPDYDCKRAYDFFDDRFDGATMDIINRFAAMGLSTPRIYENLSRFMPTVMKQWPDRMHEMICLSVEHAVRNTTLKGTP